MKSTLTKDLPNGGMVKATVQLDDECKNGHEDFAITGEVYFTKRRSDCDMCGCIHEEILKHFPHLELFTKLHLSDSKGVPMYAIPNGKYHIDQQSRDRVKSHFRTTEEETDKLMTLKDLPKEYVFLVVSDMGLFDRWEEEANKAISVLEGMTGQDFKPTGFRSLGVDPGCIGEERRKVENGYYSPDNIQKRAKEKEERRRSKEIEKIRTRLAKSIETDTAKANIKILLIGNGVNLDNILVYKNKLQFNYRDSQYTKYCKVWTEEEVLRVRRDLMSEFLSLGVEEIKIGEKRIF